MTLFHLSLPLPLYITGIHIVHIWVTIPTCPFFRLNDNDDIEEYAHIVYHSTYEKENRSKRENFEEDRRTEKIIVKAWTIYNVTDFNDNQIHEMAGILKIFSSSFVVHAISSEKLLITFPYNAACGNESNEKRRGWKPIFPTFFLKLFKIFSLFCLN